MKLNWPDLKIPPINLLVIGPAMSNKKYQPDLEKFKQAFDQAKVDYSITQGEVSKNFTLKLEDWLIDFIFDRRLKFKEIRIYDEPNEKPYIPSLDDYQDDAPDSD